MIHLNEIMEILGDNILRAEYDAELKSQREAEGATIRKASAAALRAWKVAGPGPRMPSVWPARLWFGALACGVAVFALIVLLSDWRESQWWQTHGAMNLAYVPPVRPEKPIPGPLAAVHALNATPTQAPAPGSVTEAARLLSRKSGNPASNYAENNEVSPLVEEARQAMAGQDVTLIQNSPPPPKPVSQGLAASPAKRPEVSPPDSTSADEPWTGEWKYLATLGGGSGGTFRPASIEMQLHANGRNVRGVYKARYKDTRKFFDTVEFSFEGFSSGNEQLRGIWVDPAGAKGEFELRRVDPKVVEMNWWTTAFGRKRALASGTARLMEIDR